MESTNQSQAVQSSAKTSVSDDEAEAALIRPILHADGVKTAGLTLPQLRAALAALRNRQAERAEYEKRERERLTREASEREIAEAREAAKLRALNVRRSLGLPDDATDEQVNAAIEVKREERRQAERRHAAADAFAGGGFPALHIEHLDSLDADNKRWVSLRDELVRRAREGEGYLVALLGPRGGGKTQLAVSVAHDFCMAAGGDVGVRYCRALDLFRQVRAAFKEGADVDEELIIKGFARVGLLVIDEVHQRGYSAFEDNTLVNIIDQRYADWRVPTILIANQTKAEFGAAIGDSIVSRIHEKGEAFVLEDKTYRRPGMWRE